mgnify:CR=1 FL=1
MAVILFLGFSSGLPLFLTSQTLQAWMTVEGVDLTTIGLFSLVSLPYSLKFLWAPVFDRYVPPFLGRRRGWLVVTQVGLLLSGADINYYLSARPPVFLTAVSIVAVLVLAAAIPMLALTTRCTSPTRRPCPTPGSTACRRVSSRRSR